MAHSLIQRINWWLLAGLLLLGSGVYFIHFAIDRTAFVWLLGAIAVSVLGFLILLQTGRKMPHSVRLLLILGMFIRVPLIFQEPNLSDDYLRYWWDGYVTTQGHNPFLERPSEVDVTLPAKVDNLVHSKDFHTVYPPLAQSLFIVSYWLGDGDLYYGSVWMKFFIWLMELLSVFLIIQILTYLNRPPWWALLYAVNPMIILELVGNIHAEAGMITGMLGAIWFMLKSKHWNTGAALAGSALFKIIPLMWLPIFTRVLKTWRSRIIIASVSLLLTLLAFIPYKPVEVFPQLSETLSLYFNLFAFNGGLYQLVRGAFPNASHDTVTQFFTLIFLLYGAAIFLLSNPKRDWIVAMMLLLGAYHLLAASVHPWYLAPLVALAALTRNTFPIVWSLLAIVSYGAYQHHPVSESTIWLLVEYVPVWGLFIWANIKWLKAQELHLSN